MTARIGEKLTADNARRLREVTTYPWPSDGWYARAVFAGRFLEQRLIRVKVCRDGRRPYVLTPAGRAALQGGK